MTEKQLAPVAHLVTAFLPRTENWIYSQLVNERRYRPIVLTHRRLPDCDFPFEPVYSWGDMPALIRGWHRLARKARGSQANPFFLSILRREECRVIHAHFGMLGYAALSLKEASGLPLVTTFYGYDAGEVPRRPGWLDKYGRLFAEGDLFLVEGPNLKKTLVALGCPSEKVVVQRLGVDFEKITPKFTEAKATLTEAAADGSTRILISASFVEKKGIPYALEALARIEQEGYRLQVVMVGDGPLRAEIEHRITALKLSDTVKMLGYQPYEILLAEMGRADIFLHPSVTAANGDTEGGAPVSLIEAQAAGVPVVATLHADIPDVVRDGETGLLAEEKDVPGLVDRLRCLIEDPERRKQMGQAGRAHVEKNHDVKEQVERLESLYDQVSGVPSVDLVSDNP